MNLSPTLLLLILLQENEEEWWEWQGQGGEKACRKDCQACCQCLEEASCWCGDHSGLADVARMVIGKLVTLIWRACLLHKMCFQKNMSVLLLLLYIYTHGTHFWYCSWRRGLQTLFWLCLWEMCHHQDGSGDEDGNELVDGDGAGASGGKEEKLTDRVKKRKFDQIYPSLPDVIKDAWEEA